MPRERLLITVKTFSKKDLHFFLGTTLEYHEWATNPWLIVGVFPAPPETQPRLF